MLVISLTMMLVRQEIMTNAGHMRHSPSPLRPDLCSCTNIKPKLVCTCKRSSVTAVLQAKSDTFFKAVLYKTLTGCDSCCLCLGLFSCPFSSGQDCPDSLLSVNTHILIQEICLDFRLSSCKLLCSKRFLSEQTTIFRLKSWGAIVLINLMETTYQT